jgi:hypothetical protein
VNTAANSNANQNANNGAESAEVATADSEDPCDESNGTQKKDKLKKAVEDKIKGDVSGNNTLASQYNVNFYIEFKEGTGTEAGWAIATVTGAIQGQKKLKKLVDFIEDFVDKNCKVKVEFKAAVMKSAAYPPAGFEWCESPMMACPGGYCALSCDFKTANPGTLESANSNTNSNSQSNANTRSNSNVNRP